MSNVSSQGFAFSIKTYIAGFLHTGDNEIMGEILEGFDTTKDLAPVVQWLQVSFLPFTIKPGVRRSQFRGFRISGCIRLDNVVLC